MTGILDEQVATYLASVEPPADELLVEMEAYAREHDVPIADRSVAGLQVIFAKSMAADRALEIGTAIGYSTLQVARTGTDVVTTEVDQTRIDAAADYLRADGRDVTITADPTAVSPEPTGTGAVTIVDGPALETLPALAGPFDLGFLDAVKAEYSDYLAGALPLLREGGVIIADNLLRAGRVADPSAGDRDPSVAAVREFNEAFVGHEQLHAIVTPQGDGTGIAVKTG